jgi:hypothetical protein
MVRKIAMQAHLGLSPRLIDAGVLVDCLAATGPISRSATSAGAEHPHGGPGRPPLGYARERAPGLADFR